jgi:outer membrane cobalamin receptor
MSYSKSKPSNYVTKEQIERARNVDMVEFLERTEGFSVKKSGNG